MPGAHDRGAAGVLRFAEVAPQGAATAAADEGMAVWAARSSSDSCGAGRTPDSSANSASTTRGSNWVPRWRSISADACSRASSGRVVTQGLLPVDPRDAVECLRVLEAARESAAEKRVIGLGQNRTSTADR